MSFAISNTANSSKVFVTKMSRLEARWDPNFYRCMKVFRERVKECAYPIEKLKHSLALVQYGISERATEEPIGVPMLRMGNLQADAWDLASLKYIQMTAAEMKPYLLKKGDLLFNRTNSKELVGKCNAFNLPDEYVFASYLIRVRLKSGTLLPDYVTAFLSSSLGRIQIDAVSRQIAGMTNINAEEIRDLYIPTLDEATQHKVVAAWQAAIRNRDQTLEKVRIILASIDDVLLAELGIPEIVEPPNTVKRRVFHRAFSEVSGGRLDPIANQEKRTRLERAIHSSKFGVRSLRDVVTFEKTLVNEITDGENYVGLENIDGESGEFRATTDKESVGTAVRFQPGQLLFPKLRPYLNKTHFAAFFGICSTEFHVLTPHGVTGEYLAAFLRSRSIIGITSLLMTGNTLPRLQTSDIERLPVVIPPLSNQKSICAKIGKLQSTARALRRQAATDLEGAKSSIEAMILGKESLG